ncbi:MAG: hypothetical protein U0703_02180 [Anaerolineae bacterium]
MSSTNPELGSRITELRTPRSRLIFCLMDARGVDAACAARESADRRVSLIALLGLLVITLDTPVIKVAVPRARPAPRTSVVADVTRQLSSSLSIGQVANIVLERGAARLTARSPRLPCRSRSIIS